MLDRTEPLKGGETCFGPRQDPGVRKSEETVRTKSPATLMVF